MNVPFVQQLKASLKNNHPEKFSGKYKAVKLHLTQHFFLTYLSVLDHGPQYLCLFVCLFVLLFLGKHCFNPYHVQWVSVSFCERGQRISQIFPGKDSAMLMGIQQYFIF